MIRKIVHEKRIKYSYKGNEIGFFLLVCLIGLCFMQPAEEGSYQLNKSRIGDSSVIPAGIIGIWAGSLTAIPQGWILCNGSGTTVDMEGRFPIGIQGAEEPGAIGGSSTHVHEYSSIPIHSHVALTSGNHLSDDAPGITGTGSAGGVDASVAATYSLASTSTAGSHTHPVTAVGSALCYSLAGNNLPPFTNITYIIASSALSRLPVGIIMLWTSAKASIPTGWRACDGIGGAVNLSGQFLLGTDSPGSILGTGGASTHAHAYNQVPLHSHEMNTTGNHFHTFPRYTSAGSGVNAVHFTGTGSTASRDGVNEGYHSHTLLTTGITGSTTNSSSIMPSYHSVVFIEKVIDDDGIPDGIVGLWTGTTASIPARWHVCNGTSGRPDMSGLFVRGTTGDEIPAVYLNSTAHNHSYTDIPAHTHTVGSSGTHHHSYTYAVATGGSSYPTGGVGSVIIVSTNAAGAHSHQVTTNGSASCVTNVTMPSPPFVKVAFIIFTYSNSPPVA
nr:hypothetical protein [Candidatus Sigynarchaeota archaeon]